MAATALQAHQALNLPLVRIGSRTFPHGDQRCHWLFVSLDQELLPGGSPLQQFRQPATRFLYAKRWDWHGAREFSRLCTDCTKVGILLRGSKLLMLP